MPVMKSASQDHMGQSEPLRLQLPYRGDSSALFSRIRSMPGAVLLDGGAGIATSGRYDIMSAAPDPERSASLPAAPTGEEADAFFAHLERIHRSAAQRWRGPDVGLPFSGGLIGFLGYDAGLPLHGLQARAGCDGQSAFPAAQVGYYSWAIVQDHSRRQSFLVAEPGVARRDIDAVLARLNASPEESDADFQLSSAFVSNMCRDSYADAFARIKDYIHAGDCYQVNLAQRFSADYSGDPFTAYRSLRGLAAAAFAGYMDIGERQALLCLSPERFLSVHRGEVWTQPIKGTRPRSEDPARDAEIARELQASEKDLAENLMIVDLLRNDLGRNCLPGSIRVDSLFALHSYPQVHHLVSSIRGELARGRPGIKLLRDSFPGGSITGAPKRRAMQIIAELEPDARQAYCGSLFYLCNSGRMDSNITIRSLVAQNGQLLCWAGGGIVADSRCDEEYQETFDKVGAFLRFLESGHPLALTQ